MQGGSTITQQVAKLMLVGNERSLSRKLREALLAHRIESSSTKDQILGIYLNHVYLGHGAYGVVAAAKAYFGKASVRPDRRRGGDAGRPSPRRRRASPPSRTSRARRRASATCSIRCRSRATSAAPPPLAARREPLGLVAERRTLTNVAAPYFVETIRKYIADKYGEEDLLERGLRIQTTLNMRGQRAAEAAVRRGLEDLARKLGFAGPSITWTPTIARACHGRPRPLGPTGFASTSRAAGPLAGRPTAGAALIDATNRGPARPIPPPASPRGGQGGARRRAADPPPPPFRPTPTPPTRPS